MRIATDSGETQLALSLTRRHVETYLGLSRPLSAAEAARMLVPATHMVHLGADDVDQAVAGLERLLRATRDQVSIRLGGVTLPLGNVRGSMEQRRALVNLVRGRLLVAATTSLAEAGRWGDAVEVARACGGIGQRLLEGRQVLILDRIHAEDLAAARSLIDESVVGEPWERAVAACLRVLAADPVQRDEEALAMLEQQRMAQRGLIRTAPARHASTGDCRTSETADAAFRVRHGLVVATITTLCPAASVSALRQAGKGVAGELAKGVLESSDGYAARDVLRNEATTGVLSFAQTAALRKIVQRAGLTGTGLAGYSRRRLVEATNQALDALRGAL